MEPLSPSLAAHKGLRRQILVALKHNQPLSANDLARRHGVTPTAVRRHLKELEVEHLVAHEREQRGLGAPTFTYKLSQAGEALFPKLYEETLQAALAFVERSGGREAVRRFFAEYFEAEADRLKLQLHQATPEQRVDAVAGLLSQRGFMAEWSPEPNGLRIAEHNCAVHAVAEKFPEVCHEELRFLEQVLGAQVSRERHIVNGCNACEYAVSFGERPGPPPLADSENAA
jgi:DeoR family suf operon transcriptional repressor